MGGYQNPKCPACLRERAVEARHKAKLAARLAEAPVTGEGPKE